ncbi:MAG: glutaminyl-tRNA synthase (glutamine-hydrolyzing) subunit A [Desulfobacteraceae bacterium 4484_190.2]|nr:MAG: glutaminyl-tRNA synthase (glutamine-hydrolyzing) subunit A [Desulfobacteraceae bacterium 4484_190.2]
MNSQSLTSLSALTLGQMIRDLEVSPVEVINACLERISTLDKRINAFMRVFNEDAISDAKKAQDEIMAGHWRGPLHGVPFAVKDLFDTAGAPATAGSKIWKDYVPVADANVVEKLREAGAILIGKLNMHEFAFGITSRNPHYGATLNPWDITKMCGGSSSGSAAALAAGFVPLALGTDTGGSIRIPSSLCGTVGLKPTYGLVSRRGVLPLAWSLDHVGPMARQVEDIALGLQIIAGYDYKDHSSVNCKPEDYVTQLKGNINGLVIGLPTTFFYENLRKDVKEAVLKAVKGMETLGASVREIEIPGIIESDLAAFTVLFSEAATCLETHARHRPQDVGEEVMSNIRLGMTIPATRYIQALRIRTKLIDVLADVFSQVDLLVVPGTSVDAPPIESSEVSIGTDQEISVRSALTRFTRYFNLAGNPVLCIPCGFSNQRLPVGMQIIGRPFDEATLLKTGHLFQKAFPLDPSMPSVLH